MGGDRGIARAARRTRRSPRRLLPGSQYRREARRRDRRRGLASRFPLGPATAARAGGLRPQTVITNEILTPRCGLWSVRDAGSRPSIRSPLRPRYAEALSWSGLQLCSLSTRARLLVVSRDRRSNRCTR